METSSSLFKSICDLSSVAIQDSTHTDIKIPNGIHQYPTYNLTCNPIYKPEQITTINKSNPKSVRKKNSVTIVGDSMIKQLTGPGIS